MISHCEHGKGHEKVKTICIPKQIPGRPQDFSKEKEAAPLFGLVLTGGKSQRMGRDKAFLEYNGKPQYQRCIDLLSPFCEQIFLSCREEQTEQFPDSLAKIHDAFVNVGSLGGILSALAAYPNAAWFVLACDLPYLEEEDVRFLVESRDPFKMATAYGSVEEELPEPMCAIYEPQSFDSLVQFLQSGCACPRKILLNSETNIIKPLRKDTLNNVNRPEEYQEAAEFLARRTKTIKVEYFALLRELKNMSEEVVETSSGTIGELFQELNLGYPRNRLNPALNDGFCCWEQTIKDGDTVVFIPPVSGGSPCS